MNTVNTASPTTVVLLDPTHHDGEAPLDVLADDDLHVAVVVLLSGRTSAALREYAAAEGMPLAEAGWYYLDQVAERIGDRPGRLVETVLATGPDAVAELALVAAGRTVERIVLPPSMQRLDPAAVLRAAELAPIVLVAEPALAR